MDSNAPKPAPHLSVSPKTSQSKISTSTEPAQEQWWVEVLKTIAIALVLALGIKTFVAEARWIPSGSMKPTLQINDRLIVDKISYRLYEPRRGDVVVFNPTDALKSKYKNAFIKRVIGTPGDLVEIRDGFVILNGQPIQENYVAVNGRTSINACYGQTQHPFLETSQIIPKGHYLVLGDNREDSFDGRCWGLVAHKDLVGRAAFRFWPILRTGPLSTAD
jgi:signal peptidase I